MAGRRTNLALLVLVPASALSGAVAYGVGAPPATTVTAAAHGALGLAVVLLVPWKQRISRRGLARRRAVPDQGAGLSLVLAALVVATIASGVLHATGLLVDAGPVTSMQIHVGAALVALPLVAWHARARSTSPRRTDLSRRNAVRLAGVAGGALVLWSAQEAALRVVDLPGARRRSTGSHEDGSYRPGEMPVTQWLDDEVPVVDTSAWRLAAGDRILGYRELTAMPRAEVDTVIDCTGGWWARQRWEGVPLSALVDGRPASVVVRSSTGYRRRLPGRDLDHLLLATHVGGEPLSPGHGFPARLVAPGRRGFWWVKWVVAVEPSGLPWWVQSPFPLT